MKNKRQEQKKPKSQKTVLSSVFGYESLNDNSDFEKEEIQIKHKKKFKFELKILEFNDVAININKLIINN